MRTGIDLLEDLLLEVDGMNFNRWAEGRGHPNIVENGAEARDHGREDMHLILCFYPMQLSFVIYLCHF